MDDENKTAAAQTAEDEATPETAPAEKEKPAAPEKIRGRLVPNRHDRRRSAAIARRERRKKRK